MKTCRGIIILSILFVMIGCKSQSEEQTFKVKDSIEGYLKLNFLEEKKLTTLDSISIIKIDTITQKEALLYKSFFLQGELKKHTELHNLNKSLLENYKALNYAKDITDYQLDKTIKSIDVLIETKLKLNKFNEYLLLSDSINPKYLSVNTEVFFNENLASKTISVPFILSLDFKIIEWEDLK